jgi:hypothetical protein
VCVWESRKEVRQTKEDTTREKIDTHTTLHTYQSSKRVGQKLTVKTTGPTLDPPLDKNKLEPPFHHLSFFFHPEPERIDCLTQKSRVHRLSSSCKVQLSVWLLFGLDFASVSIPYGVVCCVVCCVSPTRGKKNPGAVRHFVRWGGYI